MVKLDNQKAHLYNTVLQQAQMIGQVKTDLEAVKRSQFTQPQPDTLQYDQNKIEMDQQFNQRENRRDNQTLGNHYYIL